MFSFYTLENQGPEERNNFLQVSVIFIWHLVSNNIFFSPCYKFLFNSQTTLSVFGTISLYLIYQYWLYIFLKSTHFKSDFKESIKSLRRWKNSIFDMNNNKNSYYLYKAY